MRAAAFHDRVRQTLADITADGLTKPERVLVSRQGPRVWLRGADGQSREAINLCANNYLGLAGDPRVAEVAARAARDEGAGMASVRFICGTHRLHKALEARLAAWLGYDDAIVFGSAFDANGAVFEALLTEGDAVVSDTLNHASIIDGVRLSRARRFRYATSDMGDLEAQLKAARDGGAATVFIATDGVFSMDGYIARLAEIRPLAEAYDALILVDDCHATGVLGDAGRGAASHAGAEGAVDILTGTLGKALGGAMGGFIAASGPVIALLRQRARPYLFSNALAPPLCAAALEAVEIAAGAEGDALRSRLAANAADLRGRLGAAGFELLPGEHPIVPVMIGEAREAQSLAAALVEAGVLVTGFSYPVVPRGQARIRTQVCAAHTPADIAEAADAFARARRAVAA